MLQIGVDGLRVISIIAITLIYMLFDLFNKRAIPNQIVYASVLYALFIALVYFDSTTIANLGIAAVVLLAGYIVYRIGQIGAADVAEFIAISLLMPLQEVSLGLGASVQMPFILSVLIDAGMAALVMFPLYYIPKGYRRIKDPLATVSKRDFSKAVAIGLIYAFFVAFLVIELDIDMLRFLLLALVMISSISIVLFERLMTQAMVEYVPVARFESGDMIALNLMDASAVRSIKGKVKSFERLANDRMISEMKRKRIRTLFPVYKEGMPFAVAIFVGTVLAITLGNLLIFILAPA